MGTADTRDLFDRAAERASVWLGLAMFCAVASSVQSGDTRPFACVGLIGLLSLTARLRRLEPPKSWLPTLVTLGRALATCMLAFAGPALDGLAIAALAYAVFCADGLDGYLARRLGAASRLGARLDMESDAFLVMTICVLHVVRGELGLWVLTGGLLRYAYVLFVELFGARGEIPRSNLARYSFGVSLTCLVAAFLPLHQAALALAVVATLILSASFARSFYWSARWRTA